MYFVLFKDIIINRKEKVIIGRVVVFNSIFLNSFLFCILSLSLILIIILRGF